MKATTQAIPFPYKSGTRTGVKHTADNRPECSHPECSSTGVGRLAQNQKGNGKIRWRVYTDENSIVTGGKCYNCNSNDDARKRNAKEAEDNGFFLEDGRPDVNGYLEHKRYQQKVADWKAYNKKLGTNVEFEDYVKYVGQGEYAYLMHRLDYCENHNGMAKLTDGSYVGFTCRMTWPDPDFSAEDLKRMRVLQVDHIDGNHLNNAIGPKCEKPNLQTLCVTCHMIKGTINGDYDSPGRKTRNKEDYL